MGKFSRFPARSMLEGVGLPCLIVHLYEKLLVVVHVVSESEQSKVLSILHTMGK